MPDITYHHILVLIAMSLAMYNYVTYLTGVMKGKFKPHMFSWALWCVLSFISLAAQITKDAGPGMWQTALMACAMFVIMVFAYFKGDKNYTRSDWIALLTALCGIPLWVITKDPLWSVILVSALDLVALWPTVRKAWGKPHQESPKTFILFGVICGLGFLSITNLSVTTGLYQAVVSLGSFATAAMILWRRKIITP